jgi:ABC-type cobalamin/Fe3+-siderophores transport system ATPase subunit
MLTISNISVKTQNKHIVDNISLMADGAQIIGVVGPNGAGKTTFLKAVANLIEHEGEVLFEDIPLSSLTSLKRTEMISYCGSADEILTELSVEDVLDYSRYGKDQDTKLKERVIELFELDRLLQQSVNSLSGGERQRLNLACSIYQNSKIILWDEPTNYLDPKHVDILEGIVKEQISDRIVIIVSHDINFLLDISDRVLGLKNGEVVVDKDTQTIFDDKILDKVFDKNFLYINECNKLVVR